MHTTKVGVNRAHVQRDWRCNLLNQSTHVCEHPVPSGCAYRLQQADRSKLKDCLTPMNVQRSGCWVPSSRTLRTLDGLTGITSGHTCTRHSTHQCCFLNLQRNLPVTENQLYRECKKIHAICRIICLCDTCSHASMLSVLNMPSLTLSACHS
jgi:hypothetical protein